MAREGVRRQPQSVLVMLNGRAGSPFSISAPASISQASAIGDSLSAPIRVASLPPEFCASRAFRAVAKYADEGSAAARTDSLRSSDEGAARNCSRSCFPAGGKPQNRNLIASCPIRPGRAELMIPNDEGPEVMLPPGLKNCGMVENVEELDTELETRALSQFHVFQKRHIEVIQSWAVKKGPVGSPLDPIAEGANRAVLK